MRPDLSQRQVRLAYFKKLGINQNIYEDDFPESIKTKVTLNPLNKDKSINDFLYLFAIATCKTRMREFPYNFNEKNFELFLFRVFPPLFLL